MTTAITTTPMSGKILWIGWGDLAAKSSVALSKFKDQGYEILALDVHKDPVGLRSVEPDELFQRGVANSHEKLIDIAKRDGFDTIYVANYGHQHIGTAIEFQHYARSIIIAKPVDTCLDFLLRILDDRLHYSHLLNTLFIHDHYLNKPAVRFLCSCMPLLHAEHQFIDNIQLFLVERRNIEIKESHRIPALECGMLFDLGVHMISILQAIVPNEIRWATGQGTYERKQRSITVASCATAKDAGSLLGKSTVVRDREAETFGMIELRVRETVYHYEAQREVTREFPVLIVVGKGVPGEQGMMRDLKTVVLRFKDESEIALDLDTYAFRGMDDTTLTKQGYDRIEFDHRGINLPLVRAAEARFGISAEENPFQPWVPALGSVGVLAQGLAKAELRPRGYNARNTVCRQLVNTVLREDLGFSSWTLPSNYSNFLIGTPRGNTIP